MKKIIIVHRWEGQSHGDWYPWLRQELEKLGYEVQVPDMPDTDVPVINKWVNKLSEVVGTPDINTYLVGHSIGCQTILRYLETINTPIGGVVFVAPWFALDNLEDEEVKQIAKPWIETPINFEHIKTVTPSVKALLSSSEPYGCIKENTQILEEKLNAKVFILENKGHFTEDDECKEIPELLNLILE
jgi:predicted alpha/beta hydrolase family esterase